MQSVFCQTKANGGKFKKKFSVESVFNGSKAWDSRDWTTKPYQAAARSATYCTSALPQSLNFPTRHATVYTDCTIFFVSALLIQIRWKTFQYKIWRINILFIWLLNKIKVYFFLFPFVYIVAMNLCFSILNLLEVFQQSQNLEHIILHR